MKLRLILEGSCEIWSVQSMLGCCFSGNCRTKQVKEKENNLSTILQPWSCLSHMEADFQFCEKEPLLLINRHKQERFFSVLCKIVKPSHIVHFCKVAGKIEMKPSFYFLFGLSYLDSLLRRDVDYEHSIQGWLCHINKLVLDVDRWWPHTPLNLLSGWGWAHLLLGKKKAHKPSLLKI